VKGQERNIAQLARIRAAVEWRWSSKEDLWSSNKEDEEEEEEGNNEKGSEERPGENQEEETLSFTSC